MIPVLEKAPPTCPDIVHDTSLRLVYIVDYDGVGLFDWVIVPVSNGTRHSPNVVGTKRCCSSVIMSSHNCSEIMSLWDRRQLH